MNTQSIICRSLSLFLKWLSLVINCIKSVLRQKLAYGKLFGKSWSKIACNFQRFRGEYRIYYVSFIRTSNFRIVVSEVLCQREYIIYVWTIYLNIEKSCVILVLSCKLYLINNYVHCCYNFLYIWPYYFR